MFPTVSTRARVLTFFLLVFASLGLVGLAAPPAQAYTAFQYNVLTEAKRHQGKPYQWGATGPSRFDCSGYTKYVFNRVGKRLPRTAAQQYAAIRHVSKSNRRIGDLIFSKNSSGRIYHVGIYAGNNRIWHSPRSGQTVKLSQIWASRWVVGRA